MSQKLLQFPLLKQGEVANDQPALTFDLCQLEVRQLKNENYETNFSFENPIFPTAKGPRQVLSCCWNITFYSIKLVSLWMGADCLRLQRHVTHVKNGRSDKFVLFKARD